MCQVPDSIHSDLSAAAGRARRRGNLRRVPPRRLAAHAILRADDFRAVVSDAAVPTAVSTVTATIATSSVTASAHVNPSPLWSPYLIGSSSPGCVPPLDFT